MDFYFTNRQFELQEIVSTTTSTEIVMTDEEDKLSIENGSRTLTGTLYFTKEQSANIKTCAAIGNYILYHDKNNKDVWMTIVEIEHNPLNGTHTFVAEDAGLDLLNELVGPYKADKAYNIAYYINKFTFDSGFEIGFNEISSLTRKLEWESEDSTALARLLSVATQFDNAEIEFSFSVDGTSVIKKYINIYKKRGKDNGQTLYVNIDVNNIIVKSDIYDLGTSIYATGGTPDGKNEPINLKGFKYTDPDGRFVLGSDGIMRDTESVQLWSRLLSANNPNPKSSHIQRLKRYETTNQKTLCDSVVRELKKISQPAVNYEVDIAQLPDGVNIGDTIYLVDENEEVYLSARVLELSFMYSTDSYVATLGDYLIKQGGVSQSLIDLANDLKDQASRKKYDVKLEATAQAFVDGKGTITIVAKVYDGTLDVSTNFSEYKWSRIDSEGIADTDWSNITNTVRVSADEEPLWTYICEVSNVLDDGTTYAIGSDRVTIVNLENGAVGKPGAPGADGKTSYFHTAYADNDQGLNFSTTDSNRSWMGTYSDFEPLDSSDYRKYAWSKVKGDQGVEGLQGPRGDQGIAGPKGADGKTQYTHIAYANSADGKTDFSVSDSDREYIGMYVDFIATDSTNPDDYSWTLVKGADGSQGTPGKAGADGKTPYFHTAWANSADGKTGFSTTVSANKKYLGTYTDYTSADSTDPAKYSWSLIQGPKGDKGDTGKDGIAGKDGVGLVSTQIMYAGSDSGTVKPTSGWTASVPTLAAGKFLWTETTWLYSDNTGEAGYSVSRIGKDGNTGKDGIAGKDGVGLVSTDITYAKSTSGTATPATGWTATIPTVPAGQYLWTKSVWAYTDGTSETGFSVAKMGETGAQGPQGATGPKGDPGNQGIPGTPGANGKTPYTHWAYAWSADGTDRFTDTYPRENIVLLGKDELSVVGMAKEGQGLYPWLVASNNAWVDYELQPGDRIAVSADIDVQGPLVGTIILQSGNPWMPILDVTELSGLKVGTQRLSAQSAPLRSNSRIINSTNRQFGYRMDNVPVDTTVTYSNVKLEIIRSGEAVKNTIYTTPPSEDFVNSYPTYVGTYTDYEPTDSENPTKYTWQRVLGESGQNGKDGIAGKDGVGIKSTAIKYAQSMSGVTTPTSGWSLAVPTLIKGQYLWTQTVWTYTDNTVETGYSVSYNAKDGNNGTDGVAGKDGVGIKTTTITYATSTSGTSAPTTGWVTSPPAASGGKYIWTRTIWTYTDNTTETGYSVSKIGEKGSTGDPGPAGSPTGITKSDTVPTGPYAGMLWQCTSSTLPNYTKDAIYRWNGSKWELFFFSAVNIQAETLSAIAADLGKVTAGEIDGVSIRSSEFLTDYRTVMDGGNYIATGSQDISDGSYVNEYTDNFNTRGRFEINSIGTIMNTSISKGPSNQDVYTTYTLSPSALTLESGGYMGSITAVHLERLNRVGDILWSGAWLCGASSFSPSQPLSRCFNGWLLVFSEWSNNAVKDSSFNLSFVPKAYSNLHADKGFVAPITTYGDLQTSKYLYVTDTTIRGNAKNTSGQSANFVLREVIAW